MDKLWTKIFLISITITVLVFGISANGSATPTLVLEYEGNILQLSAGEINEKIVNSYPPITDDLWPPQQIEIEEDVKSWTFEDLNATYLIVKSATISYLYDVRGENEFTLETLNNKGVSFYAYYGSVPDADIMLLLGPALIFMGSLGIRRKKV